MNRVSPAKRIALKAALLLKYPPVAISLDTADIEINEVVSIMQRSLEVNRTS